MNHKTHHFKSKIMEEFLLIFRRDYITKEIQPSPDQLQLSIKEWQDWFGNIAAQNKLVRPLLRWDPQGRIVEQKEIFNGPYVELKEAIGGLITINAKDYDEAITIAKGCPIIQFGGSVEIRMAI